MSYTLGKSSVSSAELAGSAGLKLSTIHYYTTLGLLKTSGRRGNKRLYDFRENKARLKEIHRLRQKGYTLALIRSQMGGGVSGK